MRLLDTPTHRRCSRTTAILILASCLNFLLVLILFGRSSSPSNPEQHASSTLDAVLTTGILRVGSPLDYAPFAFRSCVDDEAIGSDIDLVKEFASSLGDVQIKIVPSSWPTLVADALSNKFDIALGGISITLDRLRHVGFSVSTSPTSEAGKVGVAKCSAASSMLQPLESAAGLALLNNPSTRIAVNPGGTNEAVVRALLPNATTQLVAQNAQYGELIGGTADLTITDAIEAELQARRHPGVLCWGGIGSSTSSLLLRPQPKGFLLPRREGDAGWKEYVDRWVAQQHEVGAFNASLAKWVELASTSGVAPPC